MVKIPASKNGTVFIDSDFVYNFYVYVKLKLGINLQLFAGTLISTMRPLLERILTIRSNDPHQSA